MNGHPKSIVPSDGQQVSCNDKCFLFVAETLDDSLTRMCSV
jgi:hypothetical protein